MATQSPHYTDGRHGKAPDNSGAVRNEVGKDVVVSLNENDFPVTSVSWDIEQETATSDFNDSYKQFTGGVSIHSTGTIEIDGSNQANLLGQIINEEGNPLQQNHTSIRIRTTQYMLVFEGVLFNTYGGEAPADDKTSRTLDWEADGFRIDPV